MKRGDWVTRNSYGNDLVFRVEHIEEKTALLRGVQFRLLADAPLTDLVRIEDVSLVMEDREADEKIVETKRTLEASRKRAVETNMRQLPPEISTPTYFEIPGKVLHLDGDASYLTKSMDLYKKLKVPAEGHHVVEEQMAHTLEKLLPKVRPDIVVITGHDGIYKQAQTDLYSLSSYKNSMNFMRAIQVARRFERNRDTLTIIAGACQSYFEALLQAGANFASSPGRVLIHALDPVQVAAKVSYTSVKDTVNMLDVISHTVSGIKGLGGIESLGSYRIGLPHMRQIELNE